VAKIVYEQRALPDDIDFEGEIGGERHNFLSIYGNPAIGSKEGHHIGLPQCSLQPAPIVLRQFTAL
jgi:hypothetical protein